MKKISYVPPYANEQNHLANPTAHKPKAQIFRLGILLSCVLGRLGRTSFVINGPGATIVSNKPIYLVIIEWTTNWNLISAT